MNDLINSNGTHAQAYALSYDSWMEQNNEMLRKAVYVKINGKDIVDLPLSVRPPSVNPT